MGRLGMSDVPNMDSDEELELEDAITQLELDEFQELIAEEGLSIDNELAEWLQQLIRSAGGIDAAREALRGSDRRPEAVPDSL
jgi:hypothetical protein